MLIFNLNFHAKNYQTQFHPFLVLKFKHSKNQLYKRNFFKHYYVKIKVEISKQWSLGLMNSCNPRSKSKLQPLFPVTSTQTVCTMQNNRREFFHLCSMYQDRGVSCDNLILLCMLLLGCTYSVVVQTSCSIIDLLMDMKSHFFPAQHAKFCYFFWTSNSLCLDYYLHEEFQKLKYCLTCSSTTCLD